MRFGTYCNPIKKKKIFFIYCQDMPLFALVTNSLVVGGLGVNFLFDIGMWYATTKSIVHVIFMFIYLEKSQQEYKL